MAETRLQPTDAPPHTTFRCELAAWTVVRLGLLELAELRSQPGTRFPPQVTPQFLKNSDDQTITALAGVHEIIRDMEQQPADFREWGVVSASRYVGRAAFAATLHKYGKDGPWGVSVQVVPHHLLHSVSSTISLSLPCQGPCLGAGGGQQGEADALLTAANLLADPSRLGVWVTWTHWDPELQIDDKGKPTSESHCIATVLALRPIRGEQPRSKLEIRAPREQHTRRPIAEPRPSTSTLASVLLDAARVRPKTLDVVGQLPGGLEVELSWRTPFSETIEMPSRLSVDEVSRLPMTLARAG